MATTSATIITGNVQQNHGKITSFHFFQPAKKLLPCSHLRDKLKVW